MGSRAYLGREVRGFFWDVKFWMVLRDYIRRILVVSYVCRLILIISIWRVENWFEVVNFWFTRILSFEGFKIKLMNLVY